MTSRNGTTAPAFLDKSPVTRRKLLSIGQFPARKFFSSPSVFLSPLWQSTPEEEEDFSATSNDDEKWKQNKPTWRNKSGYYSTQPSIVKRRRNSLPVDLHRLQQSEGSTSMSLLPDIAKLKLDPQQQSNATLLASNSSSMATIEFSAQNLFVPPRKSVRFASELEKVYYFEECIMSTKRSPEEVEKRIQGSLLHSLTLPTY